MPNLVTLLAPPDPGQLNEQPLPPGQEYCHSNAISNPLGLPPARGLFSSWALEGDIPQPLSSSAATIILTQKALDFIAVLPPHRFPINNSYKCGNLCKVQR